VASSGDAVRAAAAAAVRSGAPRLRPGTVTVASPLTVTLTGDTDPVPAVAVSGYVPAGGDVVQALLQDGARPLLLGETAGRRVGCRLRRVAAQSIANVTLLAINWDTEDVDPYGFITVSSQTVTVPAGLGGTYDLLFRDSGTFGGRSFTEIVVTSSITGVSGMYRFPPDAVTSSFGTTSVAGIPLAAGDTFVCNVFQSSGGAVNHTAWLNVVRVGP
jgi:hypothetical protein